MQLASDSPPGEPPVVTAAVSTGLPGSRVSADSLFDRAAQKSQRGWRFASRRAGATLWEKDPARKLETPPVVPYARGVSGGGAGRGRLREGFWKDCRFERAQGATKNSRHVFRHDGQDGSGVTPTWSCDSNGSVYGTLGRLATSPHNAPRRAQDSDESRAEVLLLSSPPL